MSIVWQKRKPRVLIVDDNDDSRSTLAGLLARDGYDVSVAAEGDEALKAQEASPFDIVVTDIFMPLRDGMETIRLFGARHPRTRIIAMSGANAGNVDYLALATELGADRVLRKPFHVTALKAVLEEVLRAT